MVSLKQTNTLIRNTGQITPHWFNNYLRRRELSKKLIRRPTQHANIYSLHPNQMHQFDTSRCAQWYLRGDKSIGLQSPVTEVYDNKPIPKGPSIYRHTLTDHYSGAFFVWYFPDETALSLAEFLYLAWGPKTYAWEKLSHDAQQLGVQLKLPEHIHGIDSKFPFRGVPTMLYGDLGAAAGSSAIQNLFRNLGVTWDAHFKENPRAIGQVESTHWLWERKFEAKTFHQPAPSLAHLNYWALDFAVEFQARATMRRHQLTRSDAWQAIHSEQLRELPDYETYKSVATRAPEIRTVRGDLTISFENRTYRIPEPSWRGQKVEVRFSVYEFPKAKIRLADEASHDRREYAVEPAPVNAVGQLMDIAVGQFKPRPADPVKRSVGKTDLPPLRVHGTGLEKVDPSQYVPKRGKQIEISEPTPRLYISRIRAKSRVIEELGPLSPAQKELLRTILPESRADFPEDELPTLITQLRQHSPTKENTA